MVASLTTPILVQALITLFDSGPLPSLWRHFLLLASMMAHFSDFPPTSPTFLPPLLAPLYPTSDVGLPQRFVLGPLLFLCYLDGLMISGVITALKLRESRNFIFSLGFSPDYQTCTRDFLLESQLVPH